MSLSPNKLPVSLVVAGNKRKLTEPNTYSLENVLKSGCDCNGDCLLNLCEGPNNYSRGVSILLQCRTEINLLSSAELKEFFKCKILSMSKRTTTKRKYYNYTVSFNGNMFEICRTAFLKCYGISKYTLNSAKVAAEQNLHSTVGVFNDLTRVDEATLNLVDKSLKRSETNALERREIRSMCSLAGTDAALQMHAWMQYYFDLVGDQIPNSCGEIHLEPQEKYSIYLEYATEIGGCALGYNSFLSVWEKCFEHVKIREYKQVTGKCMTCFKLTELRRQRKDSTGRSLATALHAFHRSMYMGEKAAYYSRALQAKNDPNNYISLISDGMAQNHTKLPWLANLKDFSSSIPQHLQGIIDHGTEFVIYRTFHNVAIDSNLALHCMLLQLEMKLCNGKLPDTIYLQIDGGSENANKYTLAVCELLVVRRLCKRVVLTRLPVGHTHENIDGKFALIWVEARNETILTPQKYLSVITRACSRKGQTVRVYDLFVVPDYKQYFKGYIDDSLAHYSKNEDTQLQFIFESVTVSNQFPYGAKVTYRAYSSSVVYEIVESRESPVNFEPVRTKVGTFPTNGTWFLRSVPSRVLQPAKFIHGSRNTLESFVSKFRNEFEASQPSAVEEWNQFLLQCPPTDDCMQWEEKMQIPFKNILFSAAAPVTFSRSSSAVIAPAHTQSETFAGLPIRDFESTASVTHHNRGDPIPPRPAPRLETNSHNRPSFINDRGDGIAATRNPMQMNVAQLKAALLERGLSTVGLKPILRQRLEQAMSTT